MFVLGERRGVEARVIPAQVEKPTEEQVVVELLAELPLAPDAVERDEQARLEQTLRRNRGTPPLRVHPLEDRRELSQLAVRRPQEQIAILREGHLFGAFDGEPDRLGVRTRGDDEVVLQVTALLAVVEDVDPRVDTHRPHPRVSRDVGPPLFRIVAFHVVDPCRKPAFAE